jgi:RNA polymerase sigma-70 factor (ECF subfamily)
VEPIPSGRLRRGAFPCLVRGGEVRDESDAALAARAIAGDRLAFEALVRRYQRTVLSLCQSVLKEPDDAWDAAQDSFVRLHERLHRYRGEAPLRIFVARLALHVAIDHRRRRQRCPERRVDDRALARLGACGPRPDDELSRRETGESLTAAFEQLGAAQRAILMLREMEGLSYAQIAKSLRIPVGTVMSRLFYARRSLRALLRAERLAA